MRLAPPHRRPLQVPLLAALTLAILFSLAVSSSAHAWTYSVPACDAAPRGANSSWAPRAGRSMRVGTQCPSRGKASGGMVVASSTNGASVVPGGSYAEFRFTAPAGTSIVGANFGARLTRSAAGWWVGLDSSRGPVYDCGSVPGRCPRLRPVTATNRGIDHARWIRLLAICTQVRGCRTKGPRRVPAVEANLYDAQVKVEDRAAPRFTGLYAGPPFTWARGATSLLYALTDSSGIASTRLEVNGQPVATTTTSGCDYARPRPCPDVPLAAFTLHTADAPFHEGRNRVRVTSVDPAGNQSTADRDVYADNHAPTQVSDIHVEGGEGWRSRNGFSVAWRNPDGQVAPIVAAQVEICRATGGGCVNGRLAGWGISRVDGLRPPVGDWIVRVYLEDAAGNGSRDALSVPVHLRFDATVPGRAAPQQRNGWLNAREIATQLEQIALSTGEKRPPSEIAGYSVTVDGSDPDGTIDAVGDPANYRIDALPNGVHPLKARAVSGAGVPSSSIGGTEIRIDRVIPTAAVEGSLDPGSWQPNPVTLRLRGTDQPELSGMNPADATDPQIEHGAYMTYQVDSAPVQRVRGATAGIVVDSDGQHTVTYHATDAAGNDSAERAVTFKVDRSAPETAAIHPPDPADPRRILVDVADRTSGVAGGIVQIRRSDGGDWSSLPTKLVDGRLDAYLTNDALPDGSYELRALVRDIAGNTAIGTQRTDGAAATLQFPLRLPTAVALGRSHRVRTCRTVRHRNGRSGRRCSTSVRSTPLGGPVRLGFGQRTIVDGSLRSTDGNQPVRGGSLVVSEQPSGTGHVRQIGVVHTDVRGSFSYRTSSGPSRVLSFSYRGTDTTRPAEGAATLLVSAGTTLRVDRSRVLNGDSVLFAGRLRGGYVPSAGKLVTLQAYVPGRRRWITFATPRTGRNGAWSHRYRFEATSGVVRYRFRAVVPREVGYPFEPGHSGMVAVLVRGR